jgi:PAS domain S-box-containing protein
MRVLCLEDSPADAELVRATLAGVFQLEMDVASDRLGLEKLLTGGSYDVILADYALPGFDAHGALDLAKVACPTTPFICVSGTIGEEATVELLKKGADDCVLKDRLARLPFAVQRAIDERAREAALRLSEEKYATAFHASPDSMTITRLHDGKLVEVNEGYEQLLGYTRAESIGKTTAELSAYADPGTRDRLVTRLREAGEVRGFDATLRRKDGTSVAVIVSARVLDFQGEECFFAVVHDITKRKAAEEELRESEERYRFLLENANDAVYVHVVTAGAPGRFVDVNRRASQMLGYSREEFLAMEVTAIDVPEMAVRSPAIVAQLLATGSARFETEHVAKNGTRVPVEIGVQLFDLHGIPTVLSIARDITERKKAEDELATYRQSLEVLVKARTADLEEANRQLREATTAKSEFLASMSHELRTPLNSVIGFSGILSEGLAGPLTDEQHTQVGMINVSGRHLLSLVDDILDLAKIEAGKAEVYVEAVDVAALVEAVAGAIGPLAQEAGLELRAETEGCCTTLHSDGGKIRQILFNLIGNAVKFTEHGSVVVAVRNEPDGACSFAVSDTGCGIAEEDMTRIFAAFTQVPMSTSGNSKGTGLGLRISREYAQMLGGEITVRSEVGVGSTFTLTLPAEPPSPVSPDAVERG